MYSAVQCTVHVRYGTVEGKDLKLMTNTRQRAVLLNVYDLSPLNDYISWLGIGFYHTGLEVDGREWYDSPRCETACEAPRSLMTSDRKQDF